MVAASPIVATPVKAAVPNIPVKGRPRIPRVNYSKGVPPRQGIASSSPGLQPSPGMKCSSPLTGSPRPTKVVKRVVTPGSVLPPGIRAKAASLIINISEDEDGFPQLPTFPPVALSVIKSASLSITRPVFTVPLKLPVISKNLGFLHKDV